MKRLALAAAALLVAAVAAIAAAVHYLNPRDLAISLAASVKADTGRELSLGGVSVTFLPRPALALQEVRFANAAWGSRPWMVQAARASADIDVLAARQRAILEHASACVRVGGRLVYATCTISHAENDAVVDAFLATHANFGEDAPANAHAALRCLLDDRGRLRTWPHLHDLAGFFAVRLVRRT